MAGRNHSLILCGIYFIFTPFSFFVPCTLQAWLTEIHEYAQKDVVIMLLGNKVSESFLFVVT